MSVCLQGQCSERKRAVSASYTECLSVCLQGHCNERKRAVSVCYTDFLSVYKDIAVKESVQCVSLTRTVSLPVYRGGGARQSVQCVRMCPRFRARFLAAIATSSASPVFRDSSTTTTTGVPSLARSAGDACGSR